MIIFVLILITLVILFQCVMLRNGLDWVDGDHRPDSLVVEPDEPFSLSITLKNRTRYFLPFLQVKEYFEADIKPLQGAISGGLVNGSHVEFSTWLRPNQTLVRKIPLSSAKRGRYQLRQFQLYCGDFLGIQEKFKLCGRFTEVVVAPKASTNHRIPDVFGGFLGDVSVNRFIMEDPVLTLAYRAYTGREPLKMISWKQSARNNTLMVKKYDYTMEPTVSVLLNVEGYHGQDDLLEVCFSVARTICELLEHKGVKYRFTSNCELAGTPTTSNTGAEGLGAHHFSGILEHLGRATSVCKLSLSDFLEQEARQNSACGRILITPGLDPEPVRPINRLREASGGSLLVIRATEVSHDPT